LDIGSGLFFKHQEIVSDYVNKYRENHTKNQFRRFRLFPNPPFFIYIYIMQPEKVLIDEVDALSLHTLVRRDDLALLLDFAGSPRHRQTLDDLSFHAKVVHRTGAMIARLGPDGDGVDLVRHEFSRSLEMVRTLLERVAGDLPEGKQRHVTDEYLSMTQQSLGNLLAFCGDLRWYKNWLIDNRSPGASS
jgi:hypothetical protein